jgi:4-hydroxybenzoate polyprenyltransferase
LIVPSNLLIAAVVVLSYLIGLTYVAKREHLNELGSLWPLGALAVPMIYGIALGLQAPLVWPFLLVFVAWVLYALWLLRRRAKGDVPRAVVSLIAGISLLDAILLCAARSIGLAVVALLAFALTLCFQRWVAGT